MPYLAPGAHPKDTEKKEVTSVYEPTRQLWMTKRHKLLKAQIARNATERAKALPSLALPWFPCDNRRSASLTLSDLVLSGLLHR